MNVRLLYDDAGDEWWMRVIWWRVPYRRRVVFKARVEPVASRFVLPYGCWSVQYLTVAGCKVQVESYGGMPPNMVGWVVGPDHGPTPSDLSSCSLLQWRRERERERAWYTHFFLRVSHHTASSKTTKFQRGSPFFLFFA